MGTWLSARFTHAACEKAEKWINKVERKVKKTRCWKHSLPIALSSCVCWEKACGTLIDLSHLRHRQDESRSGFKDIVSGVDARAFLREVDHFLGLYLVFLQCQTPRHHRHPRSPLSTKLFRHLACSSFKVLVARLLHCTCPPRAVSKRQGGKKTLKQPILVRAVVTHSLLSVKFCLGLVIFCVL